MIEALYYKFIQTWLLGLIATVLGYFTSGKSVRATNSWGARVVVFIQVWVVTFLAVLIFGYIGYLFALEKQMQVGFAELLFPLGVGVIFCRHVLK